MCVCVCVCDLEVIKVIACRASLHNNASISQSVCNLHQQLSVKLWLFNARMLLARLSLESWSCLGPVKNKNIIIKYIFI